MFFWFLNEGSKVMITKTESGLEACPLMSSSFDLGTWFNGKTSLQFLGFWRYRRPSISKVKLFESSHFEHTSPKVWSISNPSPPMPTLIGDYMGSVIDVCSFFLKIWKFIIMDFGEQRSPKSKGNRRGQMEVRRSQFEILQTQTTLEYCRLVSKTLLLLFLTRSKTLHTKQIRVFQVQPSVACGPNVVSECWGEFAGGRQMLGECAGGLRWSSGSRLGFKPRW